MWCSAIGDLHHCLDGWWVYLPGFWAVSGEILFFERASEFLFSIFLFLTWLPFFSTLRLIMSGNHQRWRMFTIAVWVLAIAAGFLFGPSSYPKLYWALWGGWLYIGLAALALILEILTFRLN